MKRGARARKLLLLALAVLVAVVALVGVSRLDRGRGPIRLQDVTSQAGIAFRHTDGGSGERYIAEAMASGLALLDYDGDGDIDIYFLNGAPLPGGDADTAAANALYRNDGEMQFTDVTEQAGVGDTGFGLGVAVGDYDNDGDPDIYLNNFGRNVLYQNRGDGTFVDVAEQAGVGNGEKFGAGAAFLDVDRDGHLDLYVANYVDFTYDSQIEKTEFGFPVYAGPGDYNPVPDVLYRNNGNGSFTDISRESGVGELAGTSTGVICADCDGDEDTDILVLSDTAGNFFWENDGTGSFAENGVNSGLAYNADGVATGCMAVDCGDYDGDGLLDFFVSTYQGELPVLYQNVGNGFFDDAALMSGAAAHSPPYVKWGAGFVDFDNDGDRDIYLACGHLQDNVEQFDGGTTYEARNVLLMNTGDGRFVDASERSGGGMQAAFSSRGAAFGDLDNDGDVDVVVLNSRREPTLLRNESRGGNHWLQIRLEGVASNRDGVGAQVQVESGDLTQLDEVHSGRGYQSHFGSRLHFGLGPRKRIDRIEVRWIGGGVDVLEEVVVDQILTIKQGSSPGKPEPAEDAKNK